MSLVPTVKSTVGELYILPPSPWSRRILVAQYHLRSPVVIHQYKLMLTDYYIRFRAGWPNRTITAPALFTPTGNLICESQDIARLLDASRAPNAHTLFPPKHEEQLCKLINAAETLCIFARESTMQFNLANPSIIAKLLFPKFILGFPGLLSLTTFIARNMMKKYDHLKEVATEEKARAALDHIREALKNDAEFLVGDTLTYADIVVASALANFICYDKTSSFGKPRVNDLARDYDDIKTWGDKFLAKHWTQETIAFPPKQYDADGNVIS